MEKLPKIGEYEAEEHLKKIDELKSKNLDGMHPKVFRRLTNIVVRPLSSLKGRGVRRSLIN